MIAYLLGCPRKVNHTRILKDFGCWAQFYRIVLRNGSYRHSLIVHLDDSIHSASNQVRPHHHESVMDRTHVLIICNSDTLLQNDIARINLVLEHESSSPRLAVAIHNSPVDRRSTTILRQERGMEIKRTQTRHTPHHLGQHTECHNNLQISIVGLKFRKEVLILQAFWLHNGKPHRQSILLHGRELQLVSAPSGLVGHSDYCYHIISALH